MKVDSYFSPCASINSKWIKDLNIRPKTLKIVQENAWNTLDTIGIGNDFLNTTTAVQQVRVWMDKWDFMKLKSFCTMKEMVSKEKRPHTEWEIVFAIYTSDKGLITRIYGKLKKLNSPKINEPTKKWETDLNRTFSKEVPMAKRVLTISNHKGNSNQNHTKIPPHPC
jgi:hypothetical protein